MKRNIFALLAGFLLISLLSACAIPSEPVPGYYQPVHQLTASGSGQVFLTPDIAYISIGVETRADNVSAALKDNNAQAAAIAGTLKELGVAEKDIQTSAFNVYPQQEYGPDGQMTGTKYVVNNTVNVTVRNLSGLGQMLDAVVSSGANTIYGIQFDVDEKDAAYSEARKLAIDDAKKKAAEMAEAAGIRLGDLISLNVYQSGGPTPLYEGKGGMAAGVPQAPVAAGQMVITINADLSYEIK